MRAIDKVPSCDWCESIINRGKGGRNKKEREKETRARCARKKKERSERRGGEGE